MVSPLVPKCIIGMITLANWHKLEPNPTQLSQYYIVMSLTDQVKTIIVSMANESL
jgi:hypothetical protein